MHCVASNHKCEKCSFLVNIIIAVDIHMRIIFMSEIRILYESGYTHAYHIYVRNTYIIRIMLIYNVPIQHYCHRYNPLLEKCSNTIFLTFMQYVISIMKKNPI